MCSSSRSSELERKTDTVLLFPFFFLPQDLDTAKIPVSLVKIATCYDNATQSIIIMDLPILEQTCDYRKCSF